MYNMKISSYRREYEVNFYDSEINLNRWVEDSYVLIDSTVNELYPHLTSGFKTEKVIIIEATEGNKSLPFCQDLIGLLINKGVKKNHKLIAVGGGIIQDITGFISSVLYRGIEWVFYPTTLLSQSDSCIGSKTSINFLNVKNSIGTFYPPREIICCTKFLKTLSDSEIKSGIGEMLHYYIYDGNSMALKIKEEYESLFTDRSSLMPYVRESLSIKKKLIEIDEFDTNLRRVFNYGHTFGHAIETLSNYSIPHGQAVTLGMDLANYVSWKLGFLSFERYKFMNQILFKNIPEFLITKDEIDEYMEYLSKDKKNIEKTIVCILASDFGDLFVHQVQNKNELQNLILEYFIGDRV